MLELHFHLGEQIFTVSCRKVREIVPMVRLHPVEQGPECFTGLINFRGTLVPVVDLRRLIMGDPCEMRLSTRIIIVDYTLDAPGPKAGVTIIGLIAERVTETLRRKAEGKRHAASVPRGNTPFLGDIHMENQRTVRVLDLDRLPESLGFISEINKTEA